MAAVASTWTEVLEPTPASAALARRLVRRALEQCARPQWLDAAELAVSEIVTNGVLHAHTTLTLTVRCSADELLVELADSNPALPAQRQYGQEATTGRGMSLVAAVTDARGVTPLEGGGKVVWFTVSDKADVADPDALLAAWGGDDLEIPAALAVTARPVVLMGLPPTLWLAAAQHHDGLLRELSLYRDGQGQSVDDLAVADRARSAIRMALDRALAHARRQGRVRSPLPSDHPAQLEEVPDVIDLPVDVLGEAAAADFAVLQDVLDEAERLAAGDHLLIRPGLPETVALRDWAAESIIAQSAGQAAAPWPGAAAERFAQRLDDDEQQLDWDASFVRDAARGAVAADDANRILAVSKPLADALGWDPADLVGRRVVALVPPRFREAHVAGFTRHLTTGQAHALNVRLELPVLRADAGEVTCDFFIEAHRSNSGRSVYVAWITPRSEAPD